jgi:hypothetical protein
VYWSTVSGGGGSVNTAAQYTWTNTHTFSANVSFTGNGIGISSNTGAIYFAGLADSNWRIGRNTGATTKRSYTNNTIDVIVASSTDEGFVIGVVSGNTVFETGYKGTFITGNVSIGNATVFTTVNATSFSGSANSATFANSSATNTFTVGTASYFVANGNLGIGTNSPFYTLDVAGTIRGQASAASGDVLIIGNDTRLVDIDVAHTAGLYSMSNTQIAGLRLGSNGVTITAVNGRLGISNTAPDATLTVTGTANVSGNMVIGGSLNAANVTATVFTGSLTGTASNATNLNSQPGSFYTNATNLSTGTVPTARLGSGTANSTTFLRGDQTWATVSGGSGTVTSVATGSGLTGGTITTTGTLSVLANTGIVANATGLYVNSAYIATLAPSLTGTGASGNWGINITGNAATVTNGLYTTGGQTIANRTRLGPYAGSTQQGAGSNVTGLEIMNNGGTGDNNAAAISFHCQTSYGMHMHLRPDGYFGIGGWSASPWRWYVYMLNGDMTAGGNVVAYSDPRLKEEIQKIESPVEKLKKLNGMRFRWKQNSILGHPGEYDYGVLANEVQEVFPEIVADTMHESPDGDKYKAVAYDKLVPVLIEAVKAQQNEIEELKTLVKSLVEKT